MSRILRAYERNIVFAQFEKTIRFMMPIFTPDGKEYHFNCVVDKDRPTELAYTVTRPDFFSRPATKIDLNFPRLL